MISYIKGTLEGVSESGIIVECGGIGYFLTVSGQFAGKLPPLHSEIKVYTYMSVREDDVSLFGFYSVEELDIFKVLIGVSGVGPKAAMSVLSALTVTELRMAVISEDVKAITKANGIGSKGASRIILELKDKLKIEDMIYPEYDEGGLQVGEVSGSTAANVISALTALGYSGVEAGRAVGRVENSADMDEESLLKAALLNLI